MTEWLNWFGLAGFLVILEMFTGTFYLLMVALGFAAGGLAAFAGATGATQFIVAAVVGMVATYALRRSKLGRAPKSNAARDPNVNLDIGQTLSIERWNNTQGGASTSRVMYRGAMWDVQLAHGGIAQPGLFIIHEIQGSRLIVFNDHSNKN